MILYMLINVECGCLRVFLVYSMRDVNIYSLLLFQCDFFSINNIKIKTITISIKILRTYFQNDLKITDSIQPYHPIHKTRHFVEDHNTMICFITEDKMSLRT